MVTCNAINAVIKAIAIDQCCEMLNDVRFQNCGSTLAHRSSLHFPANFSHSRTHQGGVLDAFVSFLLVAEVNQARDMSVQV